jgi:8-oxo-dGTP pyrophosphatase MutT (NUDIX family)
VENLQYAALPWRSAHGSIEILLVTTRRTGRWIVPKGWPLPGRAPHQCAALEALEEAGVEGDIAVRPIGSFVYDKHRKSGEMVACTVIVFPMAVARQRPSWPEKSERQTQWCAVEDALERVEEPGLRRLIRKFAKTAVLPETRHTTAA